MRNIHCGWHKCQEWYLLIGNHRLCDILIKISIWDYSGNALYPDTAFEQWKELNVIIRENGKTIFFVGNGASASMASHFAADVAKNAGIRTNVFTDTALMTALANDLCYEEVYARIYIK